MNAIVVHFKELSLKGRNRPWFVEALVRNIKASLRGLPVRSVRSTGSRIEIEVGEHEKAIEHLEQLLKIPYVLTTAWLKVDPNFDPLRNNPRFQKLVAGAK